MKCLHVVDFYTAGYKIRSSNNHLKLLDCLKAVNLIIERAGKLRGEAVRGEDMRVLHTGSSFCVHLYMCMLPVTTCIMYHFLTFTFTPPYPHTPTPSHYHILTLSVEKTRTLVVQCISLPSSNQEQ